MGPLVNQVPDVLQSIEFNIIGVYRLDASLLDIEAKEAVNALALHYQAEGSGERPPAIALNERAQRVFDVVKEVCDLRLRGLLRTGERTYVLPLSEVVTSLRKVRKSIPRWSTHGGRQGYLKFMSQYVA